MLNKEEVYNNMCIVCMRTNECIFSCMWGCLFMYVYGSMYDCLCVSLTPTLTFFPSPCLGLKLFMWVYVCVWGPCVSVYVCVHVRVYRRQSVSVAPVISLLLPALTPVLQLTCSVLGPTPFHRHCFLPFSFCLFSFSHSRHIAPFPPAPVCICASAHPSRPFALTCLLF